MTIDQYAEFQQLLDAWSEAIVANDAAAIASFTEPEWVFVSQDGITPGTDFVKAVQAGRITHDAMENRVQTVRMYGDIAIVVTRNSNSGSFDGRRFDQDEWTSDVFVRRSVGWRCVLTHLSPASPPQGEDGFENQADR